MNGENKEEAGVMKKLFQVIMIEKLDIPNTWINHQIQEQLILLSQSLQDLTSLLILTIQLKLVNQKSAKNMTLKKRRLAIPITI